MYQALVRHFQLFHTLPQLSKFYYCRKVYRLIISKSFPGVVGVGVTVKGSLGRGDTAKTSDLHPV